MMESLSSKLISRIDCANKESRTEHKHQSLPQKKFELKNKRQEDSLSSASVSTKQGKSKKKKTNVELSGHSGLPSKFKSGNATKHCGTSGRHPGSSSLSSDTASTKQGNSKKKKSNVESSHHKGLPSKFRNGNATQAFDTRERNSGSSRLLFLDDNRRDNVVQRRPRDHFMRSKETNMKPSAKHSDKTSKLIGNRSKSENRQKSATSVKESGYKFLESLLENDPSDVVVKLVSPKVGFAEFLKMEMSPDLIILTLKILAEKVCVVGFQNNKTIVLIAACQPYFLSQLEKQICKVPTEHQSRKSEILPFLENLLIFYETVVNVLPQTACEKFKNLFVMTELSIEGAEKYQNINCGDIKKKFECLNAHLKHMIEENERSSVKQSSKMEQLQYLQPPDNFRYCSIFPTAEDFTNKPFLRPNIIEGAYTDVEHYLDVQFRLLREDFVGPLREGISQYTEQCLRGQKSFKRIENVRIYREAQFLKTVTDKERVGVLLNFDTEKKLRDIHWEHSKRFVFGSLLCFTRDNFSTFFFGTVLERDEKQLRKGCVVVELCDKIDSKMFNQTFTVAESEVYFEPYRQVLNALQTMPFDAFPMKDYIVDGITEVDLPLYIRAKSDSVIYNIGNFMVPITEMESWPTEDELKLDTSQYKSFRNALTKEFVIIQGPPGTGKTFIGLQIVKTFLDNWDMWNSNCRPILVVCYTNHALDQVLEGTLKYTEKIIRIGGRSKSEALGKYNLKNVRRNHISAAQRKAKFSEIQKVINRIHSLQNDLETMAGNSVIISISSLKEMGIIAKQLKSFMVEDVVSDEIFIEWLKGDGNENPDNLFQQDDADTSNISILEDVPHENNSGGENDVEEEKEEDVHNDDDGGGGDNDADDGDDNLFQQDNADASNISILEDVPHENNNGGENDVEEEKEEDDHDDDDDYDDDNDVGDNDNDDDDSVHIFTDEYDRAIQTVATVNLKYALKLSKLSMEIQSYKEQLQSCQDNTDDYVKYRQLWLNNERLYRFLRNRLTQVVNVDRCNIKRLTHTRDLWDLNTEERWCLYRHWCRCLQSTLVKKVCQLQAEYKWLCMRYDEIRDSEDLELLRKALVVGMTTTGAARKQALLQELKPPIVIVEEAAEVLESHVVVSLTKDCEHLILIGDHKQLRPSTAVYELAKKFNFDISLFERMLRNGMRYDCLEVQHRMRPDIAELITPTIYPTLKSAPSVFRYENVKGVTKNLFFINHRYHEEEVAETASHRNLFEAKFLVAFCRYLLLQGYEDTEITILTTYSGQMYYLRKLKKASGALKNVKVTVVDDFQGEENKIILLSLVRSNKKANIGFLKVENRVCVALSRAKEGFYIIGNMDNLTKSSKIWPEINETLVKQDAIGSHLTLECQIHPSVKTKVGSAADFGAVPEGGCSLPCEAELPCGHKCQRVCHIWDRGHENYKCYLPCERVPEECPSDHKCKKKCFQDCGDCETSVEKVLPCLHIKTLACHVDVTKYRCEEVVEAVLEPCKHKTNKPCFQDVKSVPCPFPCEDRLLCGHSCTLNCHAGNDPDHIEYKCYKQCGKNNSGCKRNHKCNKKCYEDCGECVVEIKVQLSCGHTHKIPCSSDPSEVKCTRNCKRKMACGHVCTLLCFQPCEGCPVKVQKVIPDCGHKVHCPCSAQPTSRMCKKACERLLECGHRCRGLCFQRCTAQCQELVPSPITPACGHAVEIPCHMKRSELSPYSEDLLSRCIAPCRMVLECGHVCAGTCALCFQGRLHLPCKEKCARMQICGHRCNIDCAKICPPCNQKCDYQCSHSRCNRMCGEPCVPCRKRCEWGCEHSQCTKLCYQICNREPCYKPCKNKLQCDHDCIGFCGEPCPPLCGICDEKKLTAIFSGFKDEEDVRFVYLEDCKHTIESKALEVWLKQKDGEICLKSCPVCKTPIKRTSRFLNYLKKSYVDISNVKKRMLGTPKENIEKRIRLTIALDKMLIPYKVKWEITEIRKMISFLRSNLQSRHQNSGILILRTDLDSLSIKIDFVSKLLEALKYLIPYGDPVKQLIKQINKLVYLMRIRNTNMNQQEVNDFNLEVNRCLRIAQLSSTERAMKITSSRSSEIIKDLHTKAVQAVMSIERFTPVQDQKVKEILDKLNTMSKAIAPRDIGRGRREIVNAVCMGPGHWYRCPNGHYYVIGNYAEVRNQGKCPYCRL